jgi:uncharacterized DUF497 family protein
MQFSAYHVCHKKGSLKFSVLRAGKRKQWRKLIGARSPLLKNRFLSLFFLIDNSMRSYYICAMKLPDIEWDDFKNAQNTEKHGVSFYEAQYAFADTQRVIIEDLDHGGDEDRFFCFGKVKGGVMTVRFTFREGIIRIIGAGYWRKGKKIYEKENRIHR